jgi:hypothetical protein
MGEGGGEGLPRPLPPTALPSRQTVSNPLSPALSHAYAGEGVSMSTFQQFGDHPTFLSNPGDNCFGIVT